jgi:hypothetical protein
MYKRQPTIQEILEFFFTFCNMLQASKQDKDGTLNNNQATKIAAQESRRTPNRPKKNNYEDYCVTKVSQHIIFIKIIQCAILGLHPSSCRYS